MLEISLGNLLAWALQVAALAAAGVLLPAALRMTSPYPRLTYLRGLLIVCLVLPLLQPWVPLAATPASTVTVDTAGGIDGVRPIGAQPGNIADPRASHRGFAAWTVWHRWPFEQVAVTVFAMGLAMRLGWLGLGMASLARLRRSSHPLDPRPGAIDHAALLVGVDADFRVSTRVVRPVTFGLRRPVVLVPPDFASFSSTQQTAVAAHELLHVARRDWVRTLVDELMLSVLWFHPAFWWLVDHIHVSTEQVVDREVVRLVGARKPYLEALLKLAAAGPTPMLQPASLFLKHGHLAERVALLVKEVSMSRVRLVASFAVVLTVLALSGWIVVQAFPLHVTAESVEPSPVSGTVNLAASMPARVAERPVPTTQPPPQTKPVVDPKLQQVMPGLPPPPLPPPPPPPGTAKASQMPLQSKAEFERAIELLSQRLAADPNNSEAHYTIAAYYWDRAYRDVSLPDQDKRDYIARAIEHIDAVIRLKPDYFEALVYKNLLLRLQANMEEDPVKQQVLIDVANRLLDEAKLQRDAKNAWAAIPPNAVRIGGNIRPPQKLKDVKPVYPSVALSARVQGVVIIEALIGEDGRVRDARVMRSIPLLDIAALDAVRQWEFSPTSVNGVAVPVVMTVTVNFLVGEKIGVPGGVPGGVAGGVSGGVAGGIVGGSPGAPPPPPPAPLPDNTIRVGGGVLPPTKVLDVKPVYPAEAQQAQVQGVVIVEVVIGTEGKVLSARVLRSIPVLDQAAIDAVRQWEFTKTLLNGVPVNVIMTVTVNFTLQ